MNPTVDTARLVALAGLPGAGKTTLATWLGAETGFVVASRDVIRKAMFPQCQFTLKEKEAAFDALKSSIAIMLSMRISVVTDGICFSSARELQEILDVARGVEVPATIIHCDCPVEVAKLRVERDRRNDSSVPADRNAEMVQKTFDRFDPLPTTAERVDMTGSISVVRREVVRLLGLSMGDVCGV